MRIFLLENSRQILVMKLQKNLGERIENVVGAAVRDKELSSNLKIREDIYFSSFYDGVGKRS